MPDHMADRRVIADIPDLPDRQLRVSILDAHDLGLYLDVREFVPSLQAYGRGVTVSARLAEDLVSGLRRALEELSTE